MPEREQVVIVGAGVVGLSLAYELLRRGRSVRVVERAVPGSGASGAAAGMLAAVSEAEDENPRLTEFALESRERFPGFIAGLQRLTGVSCRYRDDGTLWVAVLRDEMEDLGRLRDALAERELPFQEWSAEQVLQREPHLSQRVLGGLWIERDHQLDPRALNEALSRAVRELGGTIETGVEVRRIVCQAGRVVGLEGSGEEGTRWDLGATSVAVCGGAWSTRTIEMPGPELRLRPVKGQALRLAGDRLIERVVRTPDVYLVPREDGELIVGATMEEMGFDVSATAGAALDLLRHAWNVVPGVYDLQLQEIVVGLRSAVDDGLPVIGPAGVHGLYLAVGHYRNGILLAPATAHHLALTIMEEAPVEALAPFDPGRLG